MKTIFFAACGIALFAGVGVRADQTHDMPQSAGMTAPAETLYEIGALRIEHPFSRASLPNQPVGGGFLTVTNTGSEDDRLMSASAGADLADHVEIHEMAMQGQVMKMRQLADGLRIPAGQTVALKPGGYHLMFMGLKRPLVEGEAVAVTLIFEKAGSIEVPLVIGAPNAKSGMAHGG